ncbi:MAG: 4'-phosphopantetheinyl transferase superfamily protein [Clostridiales bacterium]|jgi:4'-phosphopantetheinyl transferase|nr:4'-phosphopantetheinyl transferase superfamily protein [Clostridiales bacterium]
MNLYVTKLRAIEDARLEEIIRSFEPPKQERIMRYVKYEDRLRGTVSYSMTRGVVFRELGIRPGDAIFSANDFGKPRLENCDGFHFNVSHSGEYVICLTDKSPVGADIQLMKPIKYIEIARRFFTKYETDFITDGDPAERINKFYMLWALKESYVKASGMGLSVPLNSFDFTVDMENETACLRDCEERPPRFKLISSFDGYALALCHMNLTEVNVRMVDQDSLYF